MAIIVACTMQGFRHAPGCSHVNFSLGGSLFVLLIIVFCFSVCCGNRIPCEQTGYLSCLFQFANIQFFALPFAKKRNVSHKCVRIHLLCGRTAIKLIFRILPPALSPLAKAAFATKQDARPPHPFPWHATR